MPYRTKQGERIHSYSISESIGYFLSLNHRRIKPLMDDRLRGKGVSYGMWFFLRSLWEEDDITQSELSARLSVSQPTTLAALRKLEQQGLITLTKDTEDKRSIRVALTKKGRALKEELLPQVEEINHMLLKGMKKKDIAELLRLLEIIGHNAQQNT